MPWVSNKQKISNPILYADNAACHGNDEDTQTGIQVYDIMADWAGSVAKPLPRRPDCNKAENAIALAKRACWKLLRSKYLRGKAYATLAQIREAMSEVEETFPRQHCANML
eukprot:gene14131-14962_t